MQELIDAISVAIGSDATKEQKAAGAAACRTILAALDTEPGKPFAIHGAPGQMMPRVSIDQVLDLVIARLTTIATERESKPALPAPAATDSAPAAPAVVAPTTSASPVSRGLRVPMASGGALKATTTAVNGARPGARKR